ncbi:uncharacterized protein LOC144453852 [Glandiceps talaboti]
MFYPTAGQDGSFGSVVSSSSPLQAPVCLGGLTLPVSVAASSSSPHHLVSTVTPLANHHQWSTQMTLCQQLEGSSISRQQSIVSKMATTTTSKNKKNAPFRSTKGASKQRRDLINAEIKNLRDLLPLADSVKARLSYLHVMSLACVYTRKSNFFSKEFNDKDSSSEVDLKHEDFKLQYDFTPAINGFLMVANSEGRLLYISENVTEYLGHSMIDLLTQGGSIFDVVDDRDHGVIRTQLRYYDESQTDAKDRSFLCRMNTSRSMRRQDNCSDNKVIHIQGRYHFCSSGSGWNPLPIFIGVCSPVSSATRLLNGNDNTFFDTMVFVTYHAMDLKLHDASSSIMFHLGYSADELYATSWYNVVYAEDDVVTRTHHQYLVHQVQQGRQNGCEFVVRLQRKDGSVVNVCVNATSRPDIADTPIVFENRVVSESEMHFYKVLQQNMLTETLPMTSMHDSFFQSRPSLRNSDVWPVELPSQEEDRQDYFPSSSGEGPGDLNQSNYITTPPPPSESSTTPSPGVMFTALKDLTMKVVRTRLKRRLSEQSGQEPPLKACRYDESDDDSSKYDVKVRTYAMPLTSSFGRSISRSNSSCMFSPQSTTTSSHTNSIGNTASMVDIVPTSGSQNRLHQDRIVPPPTPITPSSRADVMYAMNIPHLVQSNISLKQEIAIPDSLLTPDPSPTIELNSANGSTAIAPSRFTYNVNPVQGPHSSSHCKRKVRSRLPDEEKSLSDEDLNTLRELAATLLGETKLNNDKYTSTIQTEKERETLKEITKDLTKRTENVLDNDQHVPSENTLRVKDNDCLQESSLFTDQSPLYAHDSPESSTSTTSDNYIPSPTAVTSKSPSLAAAGQPGNLHFSFESAEQIQLNFLNSDQESCPSEQCFSDESDASSFIDELESYDMELTSTPCNITPSHGELGFCELDTNSAVHPFHQ